MFNNSLFVKKEIFCPIMASQKGHKKYSMIDVDRKYRANSCACPKRYNLLLGYKRDMSKYPVNPQHTWLHHIDLNTQITIISLNKSHCRTEAFRYAFCVHRSRRAAHRAPPTEKLTNY